MNSLKRIALAVIAVTMLSGTVALAAPHPYAKTPAQAAEDLRNPHNTTYVPSNQGG